MPLSDVHNAKGVICSYTIRCRGDSSEEFYIYCGYSSDIEVRILDHARGEGAGWCAVHEPEEILSCVICSSIQQAMVLEVANWNMWAGKLRDYDRVRGGRFNLVGPLPYPPRGWPRENVRGKKGCAALSDETRSSSEVSWREEGGSLPPTPKSQPCGPTEPIP